MMIRNLLMCVGVFFTIHGLALSVTANINLGVILTILLGAFFIVWSVFYDPIKRYTQKGFGKWIKCIVALGLCGELLLIGFLAIYGQTDNITYQEDAVVVLGAGIRGEEVTIPLKLRLDKAVAYHEKNPDAWIVVSGGQGFQETITEAEAMKRYLMQCGVNSSVILKEEKATSTNENMRFSKEILDSCFPDRDYKIVVITNHFHIYRGVYIAKLEGLGQVHHMKAALQWQNLVPCYLRESLAVLKMWFLD